MKQATPRVVTTVTIMRLVLFITQTLLMGAVSAQERPYGVDTMLQTEGIGEVAFAPDGERLVIERLSAYGSSRSFGLMNELGRERATSMSVNLSGAANDARRDDLGRAWFSSFSPDGGQAAVSWMDGAIARAGIYDFKSKTLKKLDFSVSNGVCSFDCPFWLSEDELVYYSVSDQEQRKQENPIIHAAEVVRRLEADSWNGVQPAVTVSGAGKYSASSAKQPGKLLRVGARTGDATVLDSGCYLQLLQSPDRRYLATLREVGDLPMTAAAQKPIFGASKILRLEVHGFAGPVLRIAPCEGCNVTLNSLRWSPKGTKLFFSARIQRGGKQENEHYVYDLARSRLEPFSARGLSFDAEVDVAEGTFLAPFVWLSEEVAAIRVARSGSSTDSQRSYDWYALSPDADPVPLWQGANPNARGGSGRDYVGVYQGKLLLMQDGDLWRLSADGKRENLTGSVAEALSPWCSVSAYWREAGTRPVCSGFGTNAAIRPIDARALEQGWLTLQVKKNGALSGDLLFLNLATGRIVRLSSPEPGAELMAASAVTQTAIHRQQGAAGDRVLLASPARKSQELLRFNTHLAGVSGGKPVMLTRQEPGEAGERYDWLLLPPDHKPGDRHPLLVYFYPDRTYSKGWLSDDLRSVGFLNQHIPAARGFAVLLASMKISSLEQRGNPMAEMHEQLIRAAEKVVDEGFADPARWAIMGHSYGGYGTNAVITQTNRFKAAVALASVANLSSAYAVGLSGAKAVEPTSEVATGVVWAEGGQGRMGVAPWQDPERYVRNSPLFSADKIQTPLLLIHGDRDFVNVNEAEQMFNALKRQNKDVQFLRYWGEGHTIQSPANIRDLWHRIFAFLDQNLDIARDDQGNMVIVDHRIESRSSAR